MFASTEVTEYVNRKTIGKPLIKFWPVEALMVLTSPSDPRDRTNYIGILEQDGNPVKINDYSDGYGVLSRQYGGMMENSDQTISVDKSHLLVWMALTPPTPSTISVVC